MATHIQSGNLTDTWDIAGSGGKWTLSTGGSVTVGFNLDDSYGINETSDKSGNVINVKGDVTANGQWALAAINIAGQKTQLHVFEDANLVADTGILSTSVGAIIFNEGTIEADDIGIEAQHAKRVTNAGDIAGKYGIISDSKEIVNSGEIDVDIVGVTMKAGGAVLNNLKHGIIDATSIGVEISGSGTARIVNFGGIIGGLIDHAADLTLINRNRLEGHFDLGTGNDVFDTRQGELFGQVEGGAGDDIFKISSHLVVIEENVNEGHDKVVATAAYNLTNFVEDLTFTGSKDIDGTGNDSANVIIGNKGRNDLSGKGGEDVLSGGRGNDSLFGGVDADVFVLRRKFGKDTIEDFEDGLDLISSPFASTPGGAKDLLKNHAEQRGDDVVIAYGGDRLIIRDLDINDLSKDDFVLT